MSSPLGNELRSTSDGFRQLAKALETAARKFDEVGNLMNMARATYKTDAQKATNCIIKAGSLMSQANDGAGWPMHTGHQGTTYATSACVNQVNQVSTLFNHEVKQIFHEIEKKQREEAWKAKMGNGGL
jgi:hypothetical protein